MLVAQLANGIRHHIHKEQDASVVVLTEGLDVDFEELRLIRLRVSERDSHDEIRLCSALAGDARAQRERREERHDAHHSHRAAVLTSLPALPTACLTRHRRDLPKMATIAQTEPVISTYERLTVAWIRGATEISGHVNAADL
jgi:hypothetical protein